MANKVAIAAIIIGAVGVGGYFGAPVVAQKQAEAALDAHFASLPDGQSGGYENLKVDLWGQSASIDKWTQSATVTLPLQGETDIITTVSGVKLAGLTLASLSSLRQDGTVNPMAGLITWASAKATDKDGKTVASTGAGEIADLAGDHLNLSLGLAQTQLSASAIKVSDIRVALSNPADTMVDVQAASFDATELSATRLGRATLQGLNSDVSIVRETKTEGKPPQTIKLNKTLSLFTLAGVTITDKTVNTAETSLDDLTVNVTMDGVDAASLSAKRSSSESTVLSRRVYGALWSIPDGFEQLDDDGKLKRFLNGILTAMEFAVEDNQGVAKSEAAEISFNITDILEASIGNARVENLHALKGGRIVAEDVQQNEVLTGNKVRYQRMTVSGQDFSKLPAHIRSLVGPNLDQMDAAGFEELVSKGDWKTLLTDVDFGTTEIEKYAISTSQPVPMDMSIEKLTSRMRVHKSGQLELGMSMTDFAMPTDKFAAQPGLKPIGLAMLERIGETAVSDMELDLNYDLAGNVLDIRNLGFGVERLGKAAITTRLGLPPMQVLASAGQQASMIAMSQTMLHKTRVRLQDDGMLGIALADFARQQQISADQFRQQMAAAAKLQGSAMGTDRTVQLGDVAASFLSTGGGMELVADIEQAQPLIALMAGAGQPAAILDLLKISAKHLPK